MFKKYIVLFILAFLLGAVSLALVNKYFTKKDATISEIKQEKTIKSDYKETQIDSIGNSEGFADIFQDEEALFKKNNQDLNYLNKIDFIHKQPDYGATYVNIFSFEQNLFEHYSTQRDLTFNKTLIMTINHNCNEDNMVLVKYLKYILLKIKINKILSKELINYLKNDSINLDNNFKKFYSKDDWHIELKIIKLDLQKTIVTISISGGICLL